MRTVKQVSDLTGISVRALHYYDEIGLLRPSEVTKSGYRLYDDVALETLQQILFFKELDIPLKDIKDIMLSPYFDKVQALNKQRKLLILKRKKLDDLIELADKSLKGESSMNFKEFDMSEYFNVLEEFKTEQRDRMIKIYGNVDNYDEVIQSAKRNKDKIAEDAMKRYKNGKDFAKAIKRNLNNDSIFNLADKFEQFRKDILEERHVKLAELYKELTSDLNREPSSIYAQKIAEDITKIAKSDYEIFKGEVGEYSWNTSTKHYSLEFGWSKDIDKKYGNGSSKFIGQVFEVYLKDKQPRVEILYRKLTSDLNKDINSKEIQKIVKDIDDESKKINNYYKIGYEENNLGSMAEYYLENEKLIEVIDKKYGRGSSKFIGKAFKVYSKSINN